MLVVIPGGSNSEHNAWSPSLSLSLSCSLSKAQMLQKYLIIHTYNDNAWIVVVVAGCRRRSLQGLVGGATLYNNCCCRNTMGICRKIIAYLCGQQNVRGARRVCQNFWGLLCDCWCVCSHSTPQYIQMIHTHTDAESPTQMPSAILILCQISETQLNAHVSSWQMANNQTRRETDRAEEGDRHREKGTKSEAGYRSLHTTINTNSTQNTTALLLDSQLNHNNSS